jgi:3-aminobutyryl-CoA ammonia-lyase
MTAAGHDPHASLRVVHRRYLPAAASHYGGGLIDGALVLGLFGDVATEICIRLDGDEGLFAGYDEVRFLAPVRTGDIIEAEGSVVRRGRRSRRVDFVARVPCRAAPERGPSAADVLDPPLVVVRASGTVVVPAGGEPPPAGRGAR